MATYRCNACGGVYQHPQSDGSGYFHACGPMHNPDYDAQFTTDEDGKRVPKAAFDLTIPEMIERPDKRDENVRLLPSGKTALKAEGAGKDVVK